MSRAGPVPAYAASLINFPNNVNIDVPIVTYYWHEEVCTRQGTGLRVTLTSHNSVS